MKLRSVELSNFKAFGDTTRFELAPITLIFGENSAGKSSILQSLSLMKQTRESREAGAPLLPRVEGGITDLGSFQEMLFDHDLSRTLSIGLQVDTTDGALHPSATHRWFGGLSPESIGLSIRFHRSGPQDEVEVPDLDVNCSMLNEPLASFALRGLNSRERKFVDEFYWHPSRGRHRAQQRKLRAAVCTRLSDSPDMWTDVYSAWVKNTDAIRSALEDIEKDAVKGAGPFVMRADRDDSSDARKERENWHRRVRQALSFYSSKFSVVEFVKRMTTEAHSTVLAMDGFIPVQLPYTAAAPEFVALKYRITRDTHKLPILDISDIAPFVGHVLDDVLESLFPMGPFRRPPERWYIFTGTSPEDVGYRGDSLPDLLFRRPDLIDVANNWLERLGIGYGLSVRPIAAESDLFEVRLVDRRRSREVDVALSDVGFGISQILPFIVQTLASRDQIISIEQPEVHIHPRLQADLGDLLTTAIQGPYRHQFLVETHSEHLILRLQKAVRDRRLRPHEISVLFISRESRGSRARRLRLDEDGTFMDEWPGGFFAERLRELT